MNSSPPEDKKTAPKVSPGVTTETQSSKPLRYPRRTPVNASEVKLAMQILIRGQKTWEGRQSISLMAGNIKKMSTAGDVEQQFQLLKSNIDGFSPKEIDTLRFLMNHRIMVLMKNPQFADQNSFTFIDRYVHTEEAQKKASGIRLGTIEKAGKMQRL